MDIMGVSGWVMLQIAIGVLMAVGWSYMRRRKKVKGGQPRLSVNINALTELSATPKNVPACYGRLYGLGRSPAGCSARS